MSRLRELESQLQSNGPGSVTHLRLEAVIEGYKLARADLKPVVGAAREIAMLNDHPPTCRSCKTNLEVLRNALMGLEATDGN